LLYGDKITAAMENLVETSNQRRKIQKEFNKKNGIVPKTIYKSVDEIMTSTAVADSMQDKDDIYVPGYDRDQLPETEKKMILVELRKAMLDAAEKLEFEKAAKIRDEIEDFEKDLGIAVS
jgi:excinuclease ABC subunit B